MSHWHSLAVGIIAFYARELLRYRLYNKVKIGLYLKSQHFCPRSKSSVCINNDFISVKGVEVLLVGPTIVIS